MEESAEIASLSSANRYSIGSYAGRGVLLDLIHCSVIKPSNLFPEHSDNIYFKNSASIEPLSSH